MSTPSPGSTTVALTRFHRTTVALTRLHRWCEANGYTLIIRECARLTPGTLAGATLDARRRLCTVDQGISATFTPGPLIGLIDNGEQAMSTEQAISSLATQLTQRTLDTLTFFGWTVVEEQESTLTVADESGWWSTTYLSLNNASLTAEERQEILENPEPQARYHAHDDWCDRWEGTWLL
jgi:hypothetical protein